MRWLVCFFVVSIGCVATMPDDPTLSADLAAETARMVVQMRQEIPPSPVPESDTCENCRGTGTLGDGKIAVKCPACAGTGKRPKSVCVNCK
jgi:hypothetical protein